MVLDYIKCDACGIEYQGEHKEYKDQFYNKDLDLCPDCFHIDKYLKLIKKDIEKYIS